MENENMRNIKNYKDGFSLIEMLLALLLASAIIVIVATSIAKHNVPKKSEGVVYTYSPENNTTTDDLCYVTRGLYESPSFRETYKMTHSCSEYTFTVPEGVSLINLTLVGGGGGGGSIRGSISKYSYSFGHDKYKKSMFGRGFGLNDERRQVKINYMAAAGQSGSYAEQTSSVIKGGDGGASSPVIHDFVIPQKYYLPETLHILGKNNSIYGIYVNFYNRYNQNWYQDVQIFQPESPSNMRTGYYVSSGGRYACYDSDSQLTDDLSVCGLDLEHVALPTSGNSANQLDLASKLVKQDRELYSNVYPDMILEGGLGGRNEYTKEYGYGGKGQSVQVLCTPMSASVSGGYANCETASGLTYQAYEEQKDGGDCYTEIEITDAWDGAGDIGSGGASGTVVRILNFPVQEGNTYKIVVGKGGVGAKVKNTSSNGKEGEGGVSTAIFDSSNNLIFMATGGGGGPVKRTTLGSSARHNAKLIYGNNNPELDEKIASSVDCNNNVKPGNYSNVMCLKYNALENEPYYTLNLEGLANNGYRYGAFGDYDDDDDEIPYLTTSDGDIYNGFYYRRIVQNVPVIVGGLGGFSGFGGKAACGAYFMGNYDALDKDGNKIDNSIRKKYLNKMAVNNNWYEVSKYYEGCNIDSPNGVTVDFVAPDPVKLDYGVAGLGGGGGGFHYDKGVGNGGDGQNGYLMIDWKR